MSKNVADIIRKIVEIINDDDFADKWSTTGRYRSALLEKISEILLHGIDKEAADGR